MVCNDLPAQAPVVVAGDFNDWRHQAHAALKRDADLHEVFVRANGQAARTFPARLPLLRLDRIYQRGFAVRHARVLHGSPWKQLSDHAPLLTELELP